jgi:hypothetical protein
MEQGRSPGDAFRAARDALIAQGTAEALVRANTATAQAIPFLTAWRDALDKSTVRFYPKNTQWSVFIDGPKQAMEFRAVLTDPVAMPLAWTCQLVFISPSGSEMVGVIDDAPVLRRFIQTFLNIKRPDAVTEEYILYIVYRIIFDLMARVWHVRGLLSLPVVDALAVETRWFMQASIHGMEHYQFAVDRVKIKHEI